MGKFSPFKHVPAFSKWEKRVPLPFKVFKFSVFRMMDLAFDTLVLNASTGLKVCLKFSHNYNLHFWEVVLFNRIPVIFAAVMNYLQMSHAVVSLILQLSHLEKLSPSDSLFHQDSANERLKLSAVPQGQTEKNWRVWTEDWMTDINMKILKAKITNNHNYH
jgi:hypothetical protein